MSQNIVVITEQTGGAFRKVSFEAISAGKKLADALGGSLTAAVIGSDIAAIAAETARYGADTILTVDAPELAEYTADAYTNAAAELIDHAAPAVVILGATTRGKDLAPRLAARLDAALAMDCTALENDGADLIATRPMYGGKVLADIRLTGERKIVTVRPNAMPIVENQGAGKIEALSTKPGDTRIRFIDKEMESGKIELTEADVIVSGGRGMGGSDYHLLEELAGELGAGVGASRSAVDEGWRPHSDQVGQTGKTVSPNLYIACGISGAIQHLAGMSSSKVIVAINKDPEAPIFQKADFGIVGDLFEIVPAVTREIRKLKG